MDTILKLLSGSGPATAVFYLSLASFSGILLGRLKIFNIKLGIAGVLFTGLFIAHLGAHVNTEILHFMREFGLILFVFTIGLEVGPRFFNSFQSHGLRLNLIAAFIVITGFAVALLIRHFFNLDAATTVGLLCGAVTNTPSLGAAQQILMDQGGAVAQSASRAGISYALTYPFGVLGIILTMLFVRALFRVRIEQEAEDYSKSVSHGHRRLKGVYLTVTNPNVAEQPFGAVRKIINAYLVVSRIRRGEEFLVPDDKFVIRLNDQLYGVSTADHYRELTLLIGPVKEQERIEISGDMGMRHIMMTRKKHAGKTIEELGLHYRYPVTIARIFRGDDEILPTDNDTVEFGDTLRIVGKRDALEDVAKKLGNSVHELALPNTIPLFVGIALGIVLGSIPLAIPGLPAPAKFGLAGGPLLVALLMGYKGRIRNIDFYMTPGANRILREIGIILFLACVGLLSGKDFVATFRNGGYLWMAYGAAVTLIPILLATIAARLMKYNYLTLCGVVAGSMTDPPALEYANALTKSQAQSTAYASVYPMTMFLRIILAQILVLYALR